MKKFLIVTAMLLVSFSLFAQNNKAEVNKSCDILQGFYFQTDRQTPVGHVTHLMLGGSNTLSKDLAVYDPINYPASVTVEGVMESASWAGSYSDPIIMYFLISAANKQLVSNYIHSSMSDTSVIFEFDVYEYDHEAKIYYNSFSGNMQGYLLGMISFDGGGPLIFLDDEPSSEIPSPQGYMMMISIDPQAYSQELHLATGVGMNLTKIWGIGGNPPALPAAPSLLTPDDLSTTNDSTPTFDWNDVSGAIKYKLIADDDPGFASPLLNQDTSSSNYTPGTGMPLGGYYWKVRAESNYGPGDYSSVRSFTIDLPPPLPPGGIIIGPPRPGFWLDWNDSEGATGYDIYSSSDPYGTYTFEAHVTASEYEITSIGSKRFYYVVATN